MQAMKMPKRVRWFAFASQSSIWSLRIIKEHRNVLVAPSVFKAVVNGIENSKRFLTA